MVILGISLGTTTAGIAIMEDNRLIHWRTHSFRAQWSDRKADGIIAKFEHYVRQFRVEVVIIKLPPKSHQPSPVLQLLQKVVALCAYHGCMVKTCTQTDLKRSTGARNHRDFMEQAANAFPIIMPEYRQAVSKKNQYHKKLFEAVMAAHLNKKGY